MTNTIRQSLKRFARQCLTGLFFLIYSGCVLAQSAVQEDDALKQQIDRLLQQRLSWSPQSYHLEIDQGSVTLYLYKDDVARRQQAESVLARLPGLKRLYIAVSVLNDDPRKRHSDIHFPVGDVFHPLIADQKEPRFFVSYTAMDPPGADFAGALVGLGANFGLKRWPGKLGGEGWQFGWFGAAFSQFNLDAPSDDLINTDYLVGFPLTYKRQRNSLRLRLYHQSSHLGDEFILSGNSPVPENLSVEIIDVLFAREWRGVRLYAGGGYLIRHDPEDLDPKMTQLGLDYRSSRPILAGKRLVGGIDIKWVEEIDWEQSTSIKFGVEFGRLRPSRRGVNLMFEAYEGFSPFGQLFVQELNFYGVGLHFDF